MLDHIKKINKIIKNQNTNVDIVSGATYSSKGIVNAVRDALNKAVTDKSQVVTIENVKNIKNGLQKNL